MKYILYREDEYHWAFVQNNNFDHLGFVRNISESTRFKNLKKLRKKVIVQNFKYPEDKLQILVISK